MWKFKSLGNRALKPTMENIKWFFLPPPRSSNFSSVLRGWPNLQWVLGPYSWSVISEFLFFQGNLALGFSPTSPSYDFWCCWIWWYFWSSLWWFCSQSCSPHTRSPTAALFSFHLKTWVSVRGLACHEECYFHCVPSYSAAFSSGLYNPSLGWLY